MPPILSALLLQAGYNTTLVTLGAAVLGAGAGAIGSFVLLRKRALISDAISHATLPGLAAAFILMAGFSGDGRWLPGLMAGAALSAGLGLLAVEGLTRHTRLREDAAIGAVLSVFFGLGVVLLTVIQGLETGRQAGISSYLLGSTAGMLRSEAETIALAALLTGLAIFALRRPFTLVCFDPEYAATRGINLRTTDLAMMGLLLAITVIGLKVAGLVLIVALTIIPPVAARFWTDRPGPMVLIAALLGAASAYLGAVLSALGPGLPTGALIVLTAFAIFLVSLLLAPRRGVLARALRQRRFHTRLQEHQGLLALAQGTLITDQRIRRLMRRRGFLRPDGSATAQGRKAAAQARQGETHRTLSPSLFPEEAAGAITLGLAPLPETLSTTDLIVECDRHPGTSVRAS